MKQTILDENLQHKLSVKLLLESKGYALLVEQVNEFVLYADATVQEAQQNGYVGQDKLEKLNFDLGRKAGLQMVLNIFQQFQEELED